MSHAIRETLAALRRTPLLIVLSAGMTGLALYVVGLFGLAAHNLRVALETVEERVEVIAFLEDRVPVAEADILSEEILKLSEVEEVVYVSKAEALQRAQELPELFEGTLERLQGNPFPASVEVRLVEGHRDPESVARVGDLVAGMPGVEAVEYGREWVDRIYLLRRLGAITTTILGSAFAVAAALIIGTAVRVAIFARAEEIYVMRLVGARDSFIRRPFLLEGAVTGLLGGVFAVVLTWTTYQLVHRALFTLEWLPFAWLFAGLLGGALLGTGGSAFALRRHLREIRG